ncbi:MAG TPA: 2OG-Fe(II) oxygenase [Methylibium sp.]|uniref:2OG-Fe(II) oxygenase n=1 Tax=Methylibium sp. TaxID=2067992 RepID=UPI002DB748A0|nr:2OG-Fe(II) oxygenase [Methylibium sp.]HEU4460312.1 2OG-Fe(II) oxygenase [Methylibium sp.]
MALKQTAAAAITPELRQWIGEQTRAGHGPQVLLESMKTSGWQEDTALDALEIVLGEMLESQKTQAITALAVPEPPVAGSPSRIWAHDREVGIVMAMRSPRVIVFSGLLSDEECDELVALSRERLARSHTVDTATGDSEVNEARTSDGMFFTRGENELVTRFETRLAALCGWPLENGEGLQILHYRPGAEYKPHYDYFDPAKPGTPVILRRGGQRVATIVTYLNTPEAGGGTTFPDVDLEIAAVKGNAVFFSYDRPDPATRSLHGGAPVVAGEKWVATKWLRSGRFD